MAIDPHRPEAMTPTGRQADELADLRRRVKALEAARPTIQVGSGAPALDPTTLREGTPYIDRTNLRFYVVVSPSSVSAAGNVWRYTALT